MSILQHYYTSCVNEETGSSGFQVKAMSSGISPELQSIIERLIAYRIPPTCNEHDTLNHPIALRYYYVNPQQSILLCTQSSGQDEHGRPGNFFAHTLVLPPDNLTIMLPILYWKSPFWRKQYNSPSKWLQPLPDFEIEPSLGVDEIFDFLAEEDRRDQFYALMSAVIHSHKTKRRIVIIDDAGIVAFWIAAISAMLPPSYRPLLSFATYHHDPYQSLFLITGTTKDSSFRAMPEDYRIYFVLNGTTQPHTISQVEDSAYATLVKGITTPALYEERLKPLFAYYAQRFSVPDCIDEQLDTMAHYANVIQCVDKKPLSDDELHAVRLALDGFEHPLLYSQEDIDELHDELNRAYAAMHHSLEQNPALHKECIRIVRLLKGYEVPTGEFINDMLNNYLESISKVEDLDHIIPEFSEFHKLYGTEALVENINRPPYLNRLRELVSAASPDLLGIIWQAIGPCLLPGTETQDIWLASLMTLGHLWKDDEIRAEKLFQIIREAIAPKQIEWLKRTMDNYSRLSEHTIVYFYCELVYPMELDQRRPYRDIMEPLYPAILYNELYYEICKKGYREGIITISRFMQHACVWYIERRSEIVDLGVRKLHEIGASRSDWHEIVCNLLINEEIAPFLRQLPEIENSLVQTAFASISLNQFSPQHAPLYRDYQQSAALSKTKCTIIAGLQAMYTGQLDQELVEPLHSYFSKLASDVYRREAYRFIYQILLADRDDQYHHTMISSAFVQDHYIIFWDCYWYAIKENISSWPTERMIKLFSFWFAEKFHEPYVVQTFFLELQRQLNKMHKDHDIHNTLLEEKADERASLKGYDIRDTLLEMISFAAEQSWYPVLCDLIPARKSLITTMGRSLKTHVPRLVSRQREDSEVWQRKQKMEKDINDLFIHKSSLCEYHFQHISSLYDPRQRELFWSLYWKEFRQLVMTQEARQVLDLLTFWFDTAFSRLTSKTCVMQDFLLGITQILEGFKKEREFHKHALDINKLAIKEIEEKEIYQWYSLIQHYFLK